MFGYARTTFTNLINKQRWRNFPHITLRFLPLCNFSTLRKSGEP